MYKKAFELSYKNKKVEIEIQDFVGDVRNINGAEDLFSLSYISDSKDKGQSILVTEADINFYADDYFNIDELKTVGETDIKVKYYEDDALLWSGFVIPDFFSTSVDTAPVVSMVATDRIGTLKEISNNAESNIPIQILASCLKQTGQDLPINLIADNNHFETPIQLERIEDIASYDVIRTFMVLFNCKITLYKNAWWIINKKLLESGFVNYKSYNFNGVGGSVTPFAQPILDIDLVDRDGQREIKPTASEISLFLEFGGSKKYPKNWNFEKWNGTTFDNWTNYNGFSQGKRQTEIIFYTRIDGYYQAYLSEIETENKSLWYVARWYSNKLSDNILDYPNLKSSSVNVPKERGFIDIALNGNFTTRDGMPIWIVPLIHNKTNGNYFTYNKEGVILKIGSGTPNLNQSNFDYVHNPRASSQNGFNPDDMTHASVDVNWDIKNTFDLRDFGSDSDEIEMQVVFLGGIYLQGSLDHGTDVFLNAVNISFNDSQVTGKGLIFKVKQGGEKFSKSRDPETILFSDKINQGVNGYFYNYKYDDTSIVDLPSEFALSSVRERADMFSKARDFYSLDGNFIVNPLAKYVCGLKSFVLVGGENRREDASIIVEEIVSNTLNRTDFIYTYFDDGKDKVKTIGTASGGSSSGGGGGSSPSVPQLIKEDENGNYYSEEPFYSLGGLSAFGFSEVGDGTGGDIFTVVDNLNFTGDDLTKVLSARQGNVIKQLIDNLKVGEGGTISVAWDDLIGKPNTFTPSAHTHIIGDVTGLQGELDGKASLSQLDDKEDKFTKNTAFNKNFGTGLNDVARGNHTHAFESLTSIPTTLAGYGITDGASKVHTHAISDVTNLQAELNKKATNTALTTHVNKTDNPHSVTKSQVGLGNVANKDLSNVDNIQQATKTEFTSHKNLFDSMFRKVGTNIEAKLSLYSLGGLSAYGFSEEGSETGGGIVNILPSWANYTTDKSGWALSAGLGVDLNTRKADKTWVESLLEDYVPTDTTYTAGRGLTLTGTQFSTSFDIANYATVTALDGKVDKKTGFSLISDTEIARLANVTNQDISGKADKSTSLAGYGITDAYTKTSVDTLLSGKENAFTKNSAFNKNFGTTVGTVAQGNDSRILNGQTAFGWGDFRDYGLGLGVSQTNYLEDVSNDKLSGFYWGNNITENAPFPYSTILYQRYGAGTNRYNALFLSSTVNRIVYRRHRDETTTDTEVWTDKNHRSNTENDTRYKEPFDTFKTTFDTMFRKTPTNEIEAKLSLYTLGGLSAYGFSDEGSSGGGGGIVNILSDWAIYDASKEGWALGAGLGKGLYDNKADKTDPRFTDARTPLAHTHVISDITGLQGALNSKTNQTFSDGLNTRLTSVEDGSATTVNVSGTGDLLASVSKVGNNINFIKGNQSWGNLVGKPSTFAPSAHSHAMSDITNLQTTLNNKLETSIFNTHNNDNIRHITGAERTKWDGVVDDFAGLEIGSRNYVLQSLMMGGTNPTFGDDNRGRWYNVSHGVRDATLRGVFKENTQYTLWYERGEIDTGNIRFIIRYTDGTNSGSIFTNVPFITPKDKTVSYVNITYGTTGRLEIINPTFVEGNKPMKSWSPAPEDQISDWNTTDVDSFSFIKNKPTMLSQFIDNIGVAQHRIDFDSFKTTFDTMFRKTTTNEIEAKLSLYTLGGLSAYGFSDEGSSGEGGGIVNILPSWANYTTDKSGWALSAGLGVDLNTRKADKTWVESLLEDYVPTDTTYTAGRGLTLTGTQFSTSFDIANYATVTALAGKVDKKTGFSLISDTEIERLANVTNQDISGKADKATSLVGYGITDAYTKTNVDTLLSGKENAFTKNSAFNKNFGTIVGTVAQGNHTHTPSQVGLGNVPNIDFRDYGLGLGVSQTNYLEDVSNDKLSGLYWGNNVTENAPFQYSTILYQRYGTGDYRYNALFLGSTENRIVYRRHRGGVTTDTEVWTDKNLRSNSENDTRYKEPFDAFKTTFDTMFRKTPTNEIEAKLSLYTLGGLSAYGFSDEGSSGEGGGIVNILPSWANYTTDKSGWALSAGLGVDLNTRKADKTWVESLLEDYVPTDTKYTAGRGLTLTGTQFSTSFDIANYATVTALGNKVDKVTGKSLISDTEIARLSSVTNQDLTPYALKTYVDTEVGKKWTYSEATIKAVKVSNAFNSDTVNGFTVGINVPSNAKFTDTIVDISGKVDKVTGKGLSTNDFTTAEKNKLATLENQTKVSLGLDNVTNESKLTMFANPTFTGTTKVTILELNSNWKVLKSGNELEFRYNNVKKATLTPNGDLIVMGGMTAYQ